MAAQQTSTPPKTKRWGIFPHPFRLFVIIFVLILAVIAGIIGIQQAWGNLSNILATSFGAVSVILAILTFWPSTKSNEASALISPVIPQPDTSFQINNYNYINQGQQPSTQNFHSSVTVTDNVNSLKRDDPNPPPNNSVNNAQKTSSNVPDIQSPVTSASAPSQSGASNSDHPLKLPTTPFDATHRGSLLKLSGQECDALTYDLLAAYPVREDFEIMLKVKLDINLIEHIANYGTLNAHQREKNRKDTEIRLSTILSHLDDLNRRMMKGPL
jgi:hypothetical protein